MNPKLAGSLTIIWLNLTVTFWRRPVPVGRVVGRVVDTCDGVVVVLYVVVSTVKRHLRSHVKVDGVTKNSVPYSYVRAARHCNKNPTVTSGQRATVTRTLQLRQGSAPLLQEPYSYVRAARHYNKNSTVTSGQRTTVTRTLQLRQDSAPL